MPLFYFDVHDGVSGPDRIGRTYVDREAALAEACLRAENLLAEDIGWFRTGQTWTIGVLDNRGTLVFEVQFEGSPNVAVEVGGIFAIRVPKRHENPDLPHATAAVTSMAASAMQLGLNQGCCATISEIAC